MELFIGLTFDTSSIHHNKIESFRKRFDSKYQKGDQLQLTLVPPFSIDFQKNEDWNNFIEELSDLLDAHLHGLEEISQIEFNGITFSMGKKGVLALTPKISPDLLHAQESLYYFLKESGARFKKSKNTANTLLGSEYINFILLPVVASVIANSVAVIIEVIVEVVTSKIFTFA